MKTLLRQVASPVLARYRKSSALRKLPQLSENEGPYVSIAKAFRQAITAQLPTREAADLLQIETIRQNLQGDNTKIKFIDFGAGSASESRSLAESEAGVESFRRVRDIAKASKSSERCLLLFSLVRNLQPATVFEMGSCVGISSAYISAAIKFNGGGRFMTMEGSPEVAKIAARTLSDLGLEGDVVAGSFQENLVPHLEMVSPVDFLFNDGHHDGDALLDYFEKSLPFLAERAVMVFDDINWSASMKRSFDEIRNRKDVELSVDFRWGGLVIRNVAAKTTVHYSLPL